MKNYGTVSMIVPVFNSQIYLRECVDSILGQTYPQLEVILVDDGSTDDSSLICDQYAANDTRVKVIHTANGGIAAAQNLGLDSVTGDYIAFCDNDDILAKNNIEILVAALNATNSDMAKAVHKLFSRHVPQIDSSSEFDISSVKTSENPLVCYESQYTVIQRVLSPKGLYFAGPNWNILYKKELWNGVRFPAGRSAQDFFVNPQVLSKAIKVAYVGNVLYYYRENPSSVTHKSFSFKYWNDVFLSGLNGVSIGFCNGVVPYRSFVILKESLDGEKNSMQNSNDRRIFQENEKKFIDCINKLTTMQICKLRMLLVQRKIETFPKKIIKKMITR